MSRRIKIVKLINSTSYDEYGDEVIKSYIHSDNSVEWILVTEEEYELLTSRSARVYFASGKYSNGSTYMVIEDVQYSSTKSEEPKELSLQDHILNIEKTYKKERAEQNRRKLAQKKYEENRKAAKEKAEKRKIEKAKELLRKAGELK